ncbi:hypothetical protein B0H14DRAFT_3863648 [Mycena olivaceomarginata]|nr:hypothetical protein B0H14DRAFT_3863648 [Mycena olivaceomarginata]
MAHIQYVLVVPIYNIDKQPFALLCARNASDQSKRFLEGHELSYLHKAKSLFISNISHELRTPLHRILTAAELLGDSLLNHSQWSFLETVQACGTSLIETVNHVLDFTKLSGNSKAGGVENVIVPTKVDLMQLIEEAVDGCWIRHHRTRTAITGDMGIRSVYSPPEELSAAKQLGETVVDVGWCKGGWSLKCKKGGIRRVLMNVFGNSLKFTTVTDMCTKFCGSCLGSGDEAPNETKVELVVLDTRKGISKNFHKNQLFHPFSQENPLQMGTGLRIAIVNSIVKSESVNGKVDIWSEEGFGTEIKVTFTAQIPVDEATAPEVEPFKFDDPIHPVTVSLVGFEDEHKGVQLLYNDYSEIDNLNEDVELTLSSTAENEEPPAEEDSDIDPTLIGGSSTILQSLMGAVTSVQRLIMEDSSILRNLLAKWLTTRGYNYRDTVDSRNGVKVYEEEGPFDVVLLNMSMLILDGIGATTEIRQMDARRRVNNTDGEPTQILVLTGMSSLEDK